MRDRIVTTYLRLTYTSSRNTLNAAPPVVGERESVAVGRHGIDLDTASGL